MVRDFFRRPLRGQEPDAKQPELDDDEREDEDEASWVFWWD